MTLPLSGFIDLHTHGAGNFDTRTEKPSDILKIAKEHGKKGTAAIMPTIYPGQTEDMRRQMTAVKKAMEIQKANSSFISLPPASILGLHLEGPFLNPSKCGALDKNCFVRPTLSSLKKLIEGYEDIVKIITIAPEMTGALKVIERCAEAGIRVNMGHSDATFAQAEDGKKAGATGITHIFNAMRQFHHREPGLAGLGLIDEDLYIEVIADGVHLHPKTLELIFNRKRLDRIILVTDSVKSNRKKAAISGGKPVYDKKGILAGSGITLSDSFAVLRDVGIPEAEIIEAATDNPARYISHKRS
ncbi:MAG: N-acetylglucosamine-6-phosphate deacetylase [Nitrospirae bacterium]|nr:N-acetylglucosamine-6-phosphate deacetylase [Nitrospirota bacterium]